MASIGSLLREARERNGMTVVDAASRLHIRAMFVEAIEREDWRTIGEPVYVRGFVKNYARLVGVDPQPLADQLSADDREAGREATSQFAPVSGDRAPRFRYPVLLSAMSIVALALVARLVWTIATPSAIGHGEVQPPAAAGATVQDVLSLGHSAASLSHADNASGVDLRLQITQPCWLSVMVDGKRVVYETLPAGTIKEFKGTREISIRAGNAGGVEATVDGQALGILGSQGQVKDRVFAVRTSPVGSAPTHE